MANKIDEKINKLRDITDEFLRIEYYSHTEDYMYKIFNVFTHYNQEKLVLCAVDDGIEKALDLAIEEISKKKKVFFEGEE